MFLKVFNIVLKLNYGDYYNHIYYKAMIIMYIIIIINICTTHDDVYSAYILSIIKH